MIVRGLTFSVKFIISEKLEDLATLIATSQITSFMAWLCIPIDQRALTSVVFIQSKSIHQFTFWKWIIFTIVRFLIIVSIVFSYLYRFPMQKIYSNECDWQLVYLSIFLNTVCSLCESVCTFSFSVERLYSPEVNLFLWEFFLIWHILISLTRSYEISLEMISG